MAAAAARRVLTLLTLLLGLHVTTAQDPDCVPNCEGVAEGGMTADPINCYQFYFCVDGEPTQEPFSCPDGTYFDWQDTMECVEGDDCTPMCAGTASCSYECLPGATTISDPYDCSKYYQCVGSDPVELTCPAETPYFDGLQCQDDVTRCCHCKPYCYEDDVVGTLIPDPVNCTNYFFCAEPSSFADVAGHCPDGEHFDFNTGICSSSVPCITLCPDLRHRRLHPVLHRPRC